MTLTYSYIQLKDMYYFYHREIYIARDMFTNVHTIVLIEMLGLDTVPYMICMDWFEQMAQKPAQSHTDTITLA